MPADVDALADILADAPTMRYIGTGYLRGLTREEVAGMVARFTEVYEKSGLGIWPVVLKEDGRLVGQCGLFPVPDVSGDVEVAYIFDRNARGNGYATEAARAVMEFGFARRRLKKIVAFVHQANAPSVAVVNRLGMRFERVMRIYKTDALRYVKEGP